MKYPKPIIDLIESFSKYPGIGPKSAERLTLYTINKLDDEAVEAFANALVKAKSDLFHCSVCGNITDVEPCGICRDEHRDDSTLLVVEEAKDILIMEKMNRFRGRYHVLNGVISPIDGVGPDDINLKSLMSRLKNNNIKELILALNASIEGESTAMYISRLLKETDIMVTKLAHGLPVGGDLQYADEVTLQRALEGRREV